jgi:anthranilate synthase component II
MHGVSSPILIIDNYDSFTYNLFQMVQAVTDHPVQVLRNDSMSYDSLLSLKPAKFIISPGPGNPDNESDFGVCREIIKRQPEHGLPILGVCLGHQGLGSVYGANVTRANAIVHGKTSQIEILDEACPILNGLSNPFQAMRYHSLVLEESSIVPPLKITAKDLTHGLVMAVRHETLPLYGVQFHPESIGTPEGSQMLKNFTALPVPNLV